jgi:hypothetical protein
METIYESKVHVNSKSHDVFVIRKRIKDERGVRLVTLKMTYECYNAVERFTGELLVMDKWVHFFSMLDLGALPDSTRYVHHEFVRLQKSKELQNLGISFFNQIFK